MAETETGNFDGVRQHLTNSVGAEVALSAAVRAIIDLLIHTGMSEELVDRALLKHFKLIEGDVLAPDPADKQRAVESAKKKFCSITGLKDPSPASETE